MSMHSIAEIFCTVTFSDEYSKSSHFEIIIYISDGCDPMISRRAHQFTLDAMKIQKLNANYEIEIDIDM